MLFYTNHNVKCAACRELDGRDYKSTILVFAVISLIVSVAILWLDKPPRRMDFPHRTEFVVASEALKTHISTHHPT